MSLKHNVRITFPLKVVDHKNNTAVLLFEMLNHSDKVIIPWLHIALVGASVAPSRE